MANIEQDLQAIMDARYGKDVRQSIHDAIYDINEVNEANISTVQTIADTAQGYANTASQAKTDAQTAQTGAETAQTNASGSAEDAEAWAVGKRNGTDVPNTDPTYENNSKYWQERANYWYQQAQAIAESFSGALRPMGTVTFANLPPLAEATAGDMYNVSDEFTTTSDFKEGAGHVIPLGSNVYKTTDDKWDVLAGSPVTGIKGDGESVYRKGNVNITKANIGLGNVDNESLGSADISAIGDGSVKGAISQINNDLSELTNKTIINSPVDGQTETIANSTDTKVATITLNESGIYLFEGSLAYNANNTGRRAIYITKRNTFESQSAITVEAISGAFTHLSTSRILNVSAGETINLFAYQTSGSSLSVAKNFHCIKLN